MVLVFLSILYFTNEKEYEILSLTSKNFKKDRKKRILPKVRVFLENGKEEIGQLLEFYDNNVVIIEENGYSKCFLWKNSRCWF